ncbi:hypothetical protein ACLSZP_01040 [Avibacterium avium]|uniref:hypothetical protein n=1 Tax=Avibacterium avium TaxID=751 RepID=UPI003BF8419D
MTLSFVILLLSILINKYIFRIDNADGNSRLISFLFYSLYPVIFINMPFFLIWFYMVKNGFLDYEILNRENIISYIAIYSYIIWIISIFYFLFFVQIVRGKEIFGVKPTLYMRATFFIILILFVFSLCLNIFSQGFSWELLCDLSLEILSIILIIISPILYSKSYLNKIQKNTKIILIDKTPPIKEKPNRDITGIIYLVLSFLLLLLNFIPLGSPERIIGNILVENSLRLSKLGGVKDIEIRQLNKTYRGKLLFTSPDSYYLQNENSDLAIIDKSSSILIRKSSK